MTPLDSARKKLGELHRGKEVELTAEEIAALREWCYPDIVSHGHTEYTCDECVGRETCPYIFDPYNVGGECLPSH